MHLDRRTALAALAVLFLSTASPAAGADAEPTAPVRLVETALAGRGGALPSEGALRTAVVRAFELDAMARAVLGGRASTAGQFERFREALTDRLVLDMLARRRRDGRGTLEIVRTRAIGGGEWVIDSRIATPNKRERSASWRVREDQGRMVVTDVLSSGVSLVRSLRAANLASLRKYGLDGLITRMEARNNRMRE
jgi:ABC-type transporter MlaC component